MTRSRTFEQYLFLGIILVFFFWMSLGILKPIILGVFISLVIHPLQHQFTKRMPKAHKRWPAAFLSNPAIVALVLTILFVALVVLPLTYIGVVVANDAHTLIGYLGNLTKPMADDPGATQLQNFIQQGYEKVNHFFPLPFADFQENLQKVASAIADFSGSWLASIAKSVPSIFMELIIFILALYFGLADGHLLNKLLRSLIPFEKREVDTFANTTENICRGIVVGSLLSGLIQGVLIGLAYWSIGVPRPLFFGVMTAIFSFIPFLGAFPAGIGGTIFLFSQNNTAGGVIMIIAWAVAALADNVIKPIALKGEVEIHPLVAFVSILGGLSFFGFAGLFLGPVVAALAVVVFNMLSNEKFIELKG